MTNHVLLPENENNPGNTKKLNPEDNKDNASASLKENAMNDVTQLPDYEAVRQRLESLFKAEPPSSIVYETLSEHPTMGDVVNQEIGSKHLGHNSDFMERISMRYMQKMSEQTSEEASSEAIEFVSFQPKVLDV